MRVVRMFAATMAVALLLVACANELLPPENENASKGDHTTGSARPGVPTTVGVKRLPVAERQPVPPLEGPRLGGGKVSLANYRGNIVVLNVWAS